MQKVPDAKAWYWPAAQLEHDGDAADEIVPAEQSMQLAEVDAPTAAEYFPAVQSTHKVASVKA